MFIGKGMGMKIFLNGFGRKISIGSIIILLIFSFSHKQLFCSFLGKSTTLRPIDLFSNAAKDAQDPTKLKIGLEGMVVNLPMIGEEDAQTCSSKIREVLNFLDGYLKIEANRQSLGDDGFELLINLIAKAYEFNAALLVALLKDDSFRDSLREKHKAISSAWFGFAEQVDQIKNLKQDVEAADAKVVLAKQAKNLAERAKAKANQDVAAAKLAQQKAEQAKAQADSDVAAAKAETAREKLAREAAEKERDDAKAKANQDVAAAKLAQQKAEQVKAQADSDVAAAKAETAREKLAREAAEKERDVALVDAQKARDEAAAAEVARKVAEQDRDNAIEQMRLAKKSTAEISGAYEDLKKFWDEFLRDQKAQIESLKKTIEEGKPTVEDIAKGVDGYLGFINERLKVFQDLPKK